MKLIYWFEVISCTIWTGIHLLISSHILYCLKRNWFIDLKPYPVMPLMKLIYWFEAISCPALNVLIYWFEVISCTACNKIDLLIWSHILYCLKWNGFIDFKSNPLLPEMKWIRFEVISCTAWKEIDLLIWIHIMYYLKWNWFIDLKSYPVLPEMKLIYWFDAISSTAWN